MTLKLNLSEVRILQEVETRQLKAYYGAALLWTTPVEQPGCKGEATEFYTATLIQLLETWSGMSNHAKLALTTSSSSPAFGNKHTDRPLLGHYDVA
jgi:hypothetical protein